MAVKITTRPNGPYLIEGECELYDPTGAPINTAGQARIALCRCGASTNKPMCDGTHNKVGFLASRLGRSSRIYSGWVSARRRSGAPSRLAAREQAASSALR
jgi:CDGSH-type Zn-finger protein